MTNMKDKKAGSGFNRRAFMGGAAGAATLPLVAKAAGAAARRFVAEGAKVAMIDRDEASLEKVTKSLPADQVMIQAADVSDSRVVDGMVAAVVGRFGRLDVIVNNAGVHEGGDPDSITDEKWRKVMSTDIDGVFCRAALSISKKPGARS
jgi:NADP-dependent 3-hydroxy acid dehydrogenase YdfG